jgi:xylulose-5-phosphate/fructose-6-phosphate phosphoketolase
MLRLNNASRFTVASIALARVARDQPNHKVTVEAHEMASFWAHQLREHEKYTIEHGEDPEWCEKIPELATGAV